MPTITQNTIYRCPKCGMMSTVRAIEAATQQYVDNTNIIHVDITPMARGEACWFICPYCHDEVDYDDWILIGDQPTISTSYTPTQWVSYKVTKKPVHKCAMCGDTDDLVKIDGVYLCQHCQKPQNYSFANWKTAGRKTKKPAFSIEFETNTTPPGIFELVRHKYVPTKDASIDGYEWKSPIYRDLSAFTKVLPILDKYKDAVTSSCGTHVHVSVDYFTRDAIYCNYDYTFGDLIDYIKLNKNTARKFWGRYFNDYCAAINVGHHSAFSVSEKYTTLEYRLPRYQTKEQYITVVKFCRDATVLIEKVVKDAQKQEHFDFGEDVPPRVMRKAGDELVKLYQKYEQAI